jgi:hypothetical protein
MEATFEQCVDTIQKYGFCIESDEKGLYNVIDVDYFESKACCVPYHLRDYSKYNLTKIQVLKYTNYVQSTLDNK